MKARQLEPDVMNTAQAARYTGLSRPTFRKALKTIPHRRTGARVLIRKEALDRWLEGYNADEAV